MVVRVGESIFRPNSENPSQLFDIGCCKEKDILRKYVPLEEQNKHWNIQLITH